MFNQINQLLEDSDFIFTYDSNGNQKKKTNKLTGAYQDFIWNAENQLQSVKSYRDSTTLEFTISYKYDPSGRRILRSVQNHLAPTKSYTRKFIYDGQNIAAITDQDDNFIAGYLYDDGIDQPVLMVTDYNGDGELDTLSIVRDRQNSVKLILNEKKEIIQEVSYSAYGETQITNRGQQNPKLNNIFYYTSRELEPELGIYYYRARYYDPGTGRFLSEDPIGFAAGDYNLYRYVRNNPLRFNDPAGTELTIIGAIGIGALVGGISGVIGEVVSNPNVTIGSAAEAFVSGAVGGAMTVVGAGAALIGGTGTVVAAGAGAAFGLVTGIATNLILDPSAIPSPIKPHEPSKEQSNRSSRKTNNPDPCGG